jgi:hypothetical protein
MRTNAPIGIVFKDKWKSVISEKYDDKNWTEVYSKDIRNKNHDQI